MEFKDTNPKDAVGIRKAPMSCVPVPVLMEIGLGMMEGARKYARHNYRIAGVRASVYYDAFWRHIGAWWEGEDIDPDSGISHLSKAMATLVVIRDAEMCGKMIDDRPPALHKDWVGPLNKKAGEIIDRIKDAKEPYTNVNSVGFPDRASASPSGGVPVPADCKPLSGLADSLGRGSNIDGVGCECPVCNSGVD